MAVTSIDVFRNKSIQEVQISGFGDGEPVIVKLKSLSIMGLMSSGSIPNQLMGQVTELFSRQGSQAGSSEKDVFSKMGEMGQLLDIICREAMVEPRFEDVREYLTDTQRMDIFGWTQGGVKPVAEFPKAQIVNEYLANEQNI